MWSEQEMFNYLKANLKESRFKHSLSVSETAVSLAIKYGENVEKARIAGLVHDCAKNMKDQELINMAFKYEIEVNNIYLYNPSILHGIIGSIIAKETMKIEDADILNAISYHTTGRKNMSTLEKIIYMADYIEPLRNFEGVEEIRSLSYINLDEALVKALDSTIKCIINQKGLLHTDTVEARNFILCEYSR